ncbi:response regulator transcription factor [Fulvivirga sp.]|uniref:response regulator transcription factor n=1 Tax=Fulvivirga sp. TaxID=1931237 RepID=UPI0032EDAD0B
MAKGKILMVEDDASLAFVIKDNLCLHKYEVVHCDNGQEALEAFAKEPFDLCLLDVMLPKMDGFTLAENIRTGNNKVPILFLTAKAMQEDRLEGFKRGGDDYITKPFSMEELVFRIEVFLRRTGKQDIVLQEYQIGEYTFNYEDLSLSYNSEKKHLTQKEAQILKFLCNNKNRVVKREEILIEVWGEDDYFLGRSLDVFISKLRKYLSKDERVNIFNRHGVGFEFIIEDH